MTTANIVNTKVVFAETTVSPYYDDFSEDKNFNRILFRPGYAVQARELTQMQTIMQNQIERFGNHIFQNGSIVAGGQISTTGVITLNLEPKFSGTDIVASSFLNDRIRYPNGNNYVEAYVVGTLEASDTGSLPALSVKYTSGEAFSNTDNIRSVTSNSYASISKTSNYYASGLSASIQDSIFFMNGYFIKVPSQTIIVDPYTVYANARIGLEINQSVVTENSDNSLLDPAQESSNYQAPGAARLKVQLDLKKRTLNSEDDEAFVELMRIENGVIKKKVQYAIYSALGDELARRTYDESGNYTVRPFNIGINNNSSNSSLLQISLSPGKAYINGYETETFAEELIDLNRALDTDTVTNYDLGLNYGNYIKVSNVSSNIDFTASPIVDIHCINSPLVDQTSSITYSSTKIGTAKIRNMSYDSAATAVSNSPIYKLSLFDVRFSSVTSNGTYVSVSNFYSNNYSLVTLSDANLNSTSNTYNGSTFRIADGTGSGFTGQVVTYTNTGGSNRTFLINSIVGTMGATSNVSIDFDYDEAKSIVSAAGYTPGVSSALDATLKADIDSGVYYPTLTTMVFKFPQDYIKENSLTNQNYTYVRNIPVSFVAGFANSISALNSSREAYNDTGDQQNFMVFAANGATLPVASVSPPTALQAIDITLDYAYSGQATLYAVVNINNGNNTNPKRKTLTTGNTVNFTTTSADATIVSTTTGATTSVYSSAGQATITNFKGTPGLKHSLYISDVKRITAIYDLAGAALPSAGASLSSYTNIASYFNFDSGQKDTHYDHASISLKPRVGSVNGPLVVCFDWYEHTQGATDDGLGFFNIDSYPDVTTSAGYTDIPVFVDSKGVTYNLRDCIDFRPKRQNLVGTDPNFIIQGARIPNIFTNFSVGSYQYYLPRKSLLTMISAKGGAYPFIVIDGKSSLKPAFPSNLPGAMPLYKLTLEPYTASKSNVKIEFVENKRYTMRDIGSLEKRIENLEYYQSLSLLEKSATSMVIKDVNGLDRTKNGIIVDDFTTHGIGDVSNPDYYISMDKVYGAARAPQQATSLSLEPDETTVSGIKENKKYITLAYTEKTFISQPKPTKYIPVNPYMYAAYVGKIVMEPDSDYWVDNTKAPDLIINFSGENDIVSTGTRNNQANSNTIAAKVNTQINGLGYGLWLSGLGVGYGTTNGSINWGKVFTDYNNAYTGNNTPLTQLSGFWNNYLGTPNR